MLDPGADWDGLSTAKRDRFKQTAGDLPRASAAKRVRRGSVSFADPPSVPPVAATIAKGWAVTPLPPASLPRSTEASPAWEMASLIQDPITFSGLVHVCKSLSKRPGRKKRATRRAMERLWSSKKSWCSPSGVQTTGPKRLAGQVALAAASSDHMGQLCGKTKPRAAAKTAAMTLAGAGESPEVGTAPSLRTGWHRLHTVNRWIETCFREYGTAQGGRPWRPTYMQKMALKMFKEADARNMFGPDLNRVLSRLRSEFNMNATNHNVAIAAPRRHGKSQIIAIYVIASLLTFRNRKILVTAFRDKQVRELHKTIMAVLSSIKHLIPGLKKISNNKSDGELTLVFSETDKRVITFGAVTPALRGQGAHMVIVDEIAQVPEEMLLKVIFPLLRQEGTSMVALSTVTDDSNVFTRMMELEYMGRPIFRTMHIETVCAECKAAGCDDSICPHNTSKHPHYLDSEKDGMLKVLYKELGNNEDYEAEIQGAVKTSKSVFIPAHVDALFKRVPFNVDRLMAVARRKQIFLAVDPCGCGSASNMAAVAAYCTMTEHVVRRVLFVCLFVWGGVTQRRPPRRSAPRSRIAGQSPALHGWRTAPGKRQRWGSAPWRGLVAPC